MSILKKAEDFERCKISLFSELALVYISFWSVHWIHFCPTLFITLVFWERIILSPQPNRPARWLLPTQRASNNTRMMLLSLLLGSFFVVSRDVQFMESYCSWLLRKIE